MKHYYSCIALPLIILISYSSATGQISTGTPQFGSFGGGPFDAINLGNLNIHFVVPIRHKAGRGTPFSAADLTYDSSIWVPVGSSGSQVWQPTNTGPNVPNSYWGWQGLSNSGSTYLNYTLQVIPRTQCGSSPSYYYYGWEWGNFTYYDQNGAHPFGLGGEQYWVNNCPPGVGPPNGPLPNYNQQSVASDGSGFTFKLGIPGAGTISTSITNKRGALINPPIVTGSSQQGSYSYTDPNGNEITATNGVYTDTLGQQALTVMGTQPSNTTLTYTAPSGATATYTVSYKAYTVKTNFGCSGVTEYNQSNVYLVDKITLPDSTFYQFGYEATAGGGSGQVTARLASVALPAGGEVTYSYPQTTGGHNGITCKDGSAPAVSGSASVTRTLTPGGTWLYTRSLVTGTPGPGSTWTTTVEDPNANYTVINFAEDSTTNSSSTVATYNFYETQRQIYQGSISGSNLLLTTTACYKGNYSSCSTSTVGSPITQKDFYTQPKSGQNRLSEMLYNSVGLVTDDKEYDYGVTTGAAPGTTHLILETQTTYGSYNGSGCTALGNNVNNRPCQVFVKDWSSGTATTLSQTNYSYDQTTPTPTSNTPQHISITGSRGNLTTVSNYVTGSTSLSKTFTYYDTGNPNVATDVNNAQTTYSYGTGSCGNSFPTSISEPLTLSRSMTWNCLGGVTTQVTDENGKNVTSDYSTDPYFWRPDSVTDQMSNQTKMSYTGQTVVESALQNFNSGSSESDSRITTDGFGRMIYTQRLQGPTGGNYDTTEVDYNNLNQAYRVTMPYTAVGSPSSGNGTAPAKNTTYDALGRVLTITDANGGTISYTYIVNDVLQKVSGTQTFQKQYEYDGLGRLTSVCEISGTLPGVGTCGQTTAQTGYWTRYKYDALGRLIGVCQKTTQPLSVDCTQSPSSGQQSRSFTYDMVSRMLTETNPETGNNGVAGTITYTYDSVSSGNCAGTFAGDIVKKVDAGGNVSCYTYDALHRTVQITYPAGPNATATPAKYFWYDTQYYGNGGANLAGRLVAALTCQTNTSCAGNSVVYTIFGYSARGEVTDVWETTPHSAGTYHTTAAYWPTGTLMTLSGIPGVPTFNYGASGTGLDGEGRITQVTAGSGTNPVTGVTYAPNTTNSNYTGPLGSLTGVTFGSGDSDSFGYDPNTGRVTGYLFSVNNQSDVGTLTWNSNGTLGSFVINDQITGTSDSQSCNYGYDDLRRISSVTCGTFWVQNFAYDAFGNITKNVPQGDGGLSFLPSYWTSPPTNQFTTLPGVTPSYDTNGNLLTDNLNTYTWDALEKMATVNTGSATVTVVYDALGRMVENNAGGTWTEFVYGPTGKLAKCNGQSLVKALISLPGGATAVYNTNGLAYFRHSDWLGSSRLTSTASRPTQMYSSSAYAPFGEQYATAGTADASYTGQTPDTVASLYDFPARRHSPSQGRWISPDPSGRAAVTLTNPQSWNRYAYTLNNPLTLVDPMGLDEENSCDQDDWGDDDCSDDGGDGGGGGDGGSGGDNSGCDPTMDPNCSRSGDNGIQQPSTCDPSDSSCSGSQSVNQPNPATCQAGDFSCNPFDDGCLTLYSAQCQSGAAALQTIIAGDDPCIFIQTDKNGNYNGNYTVNNNLNQQQCSQQHGQWAPPGYNWSVNSNGQVEVAWISQSACVGYQAFSWWLLGFNGGVAVASGGTASVALPFTLGNALLSNIVCQGSQATHL